MKFHRNPDKIDTTMEVEHRRGNSIYKIIRKAYIYSVHIVASDTNLYLRQDQFESFHGLTQKDILFI